MNNLPQSINEPPKSWIDRLQASFEILLMSGLISGFLATLPFLAFKLRSIDLFINDSRIISIYLLMESCISFLILAAILKLHREPISSLGLNWNCWKSNLLIGLVLVPFLFLINIIIATLFKTYLPEYYLDKNPLSQSIHTPFQLSLFIFSALIAGGIKEELQRAFILNRFRSYLGGAEAGLVLWSIAFGAGHYIQGFQGVVIATILGIFFGLVYLKRKSLIAPILSHGIYDALALLAYWYLR
jgi:membrane protease YdiL (CAAX protease family)